MGDYHRYLYDFEAGRIVGDYESAYKNCADVNPTQHDVDTLKHRLAVDHFARYTRPAALLDVGCGYGVFVDALRRKGFAASGCDVSSSAISQGHERYPEAHLFVGDLRDGLEVIDNSYDGVILFGVIWFLLEDLDSCLAEIKRVLKPGGELFATLTFAPNQKLGKDVIACPNDLHEYMARHFTVREFLAITDARALREGNSPETCEQDILAVGRKEA